MSASICLFLFFPFWLPYRSLWSVCATNNWIVRFVLSKRHCTCICLASMQFQDIDIILLCCLMVVWQILFFFSQKGKSDAAIVSFSAIELHVVPEDAQLKAANWPHYRVYLQQGKLDSSNQVCCTSTVNEKKLKSDWCQHGRNKHTTYTHVTECIHAHKHTCGRKAYEYDLALPAPQQRKGEVDFIQGLAQRVWNEVYSAK